jgi:5,10-methylenetetrahydromethanopterin reductase
MREYLPVLLLLDGTAVSVDGSTLSAHIGLTTPRAGPVPVLLAAMAPRMLTMAGQQTNSTVLWMTGAATIRDYVVPAISAGASAAGPPQPYEEDRHARRKSCPCPCPFDLSVSRT